MLMRLVRMQMLQDMEPDMVLMDSQQIFVVLVQMQLVLVPDMVHRVQTDMVLVQQMLQDMELPERMVMALVLQVQLVSQVVV